MQSETPQPKTQAISWDRLRLLQSVKSKLHIMLLQYDGLNEEQLRYMYKATHGSALEPSLMGHRDLVSLARSIPDVVTLESRAGQFVFHPTCTPGSASMVPGSVTMPVVSGGAPTSPDMSPSELGLEHMSLSSLAPAATPPQALAQPQPQAWQLSLASTMAQQQPSSMVQQQPSSPVSPNDWRMHQAAQAWADVQPSSSPSSNIFQMWGQPTGSHSPSSPQTMSSPSIWGQPLGRTPTSSSTAGFAHAATPERHSMACMRTMLAQARTHACACTHAHAHMRMHARTHMARMRVHPCTNVHIHTHIHTRAHTHMTYAM